MKVSYVRRAIALTSVASLAGLALGATAPQASAAPKGNITITNTLPRWLSKATKVALATAALPATQEVRVYLVPKGGLDALKAEVAALSTPGSATYRHWLTTTQYDARYAPTQASADAVSTFLAAKGLTVTGVEAHRRYVVATGTAAQLGSAFGVSLGTYRHDGQTVTAPGSAVVLPASVGANVLTVTGLDTTFVARTHNNVTPATVATAPATATPSAVPPAGFVNGRPCAINFGNPLATYKADYSTPLPKFKGKTLPYAPCGYTGPSFRAAYEGSTTLTGAGVTVAITDAYAWQFIAKDANTYAVNHGDGSYTAGQLTQNLPAQVHEPGRLRPELLVR